eukprot:scaffold2309_cov248-Pinguiococcus_pyrenoidosus.AAC.3
MYSLPPCGFRQFYIRTSHKSTTVEKRATPGQLHFRAKSRREMSATQHFAVGVLAAPHPLAFIPLCDAWALQPRGAKFFRQSREECPNRRPVPSPFPLFTTPGQI